MKRDIFLFLITAIFSLLCHAHEGGHFETNDLLAGLKPDEKVALLMVHFGTSYEETRSLTIDAINDRAKEAFPDLTVREAYTSRMIMRKLKAHGIHKDSPLEAMLKLRSEGYTHLVVQSTHIIDGAEMESLRRDVESVKPFFKEIRVGTPLLYTVENAEQVVSILTKHLNVPTAKGKSKEQVVLVGHGTYTPITSTYSQLDYMLKASGQKHMHVGTVEGYPTFDTVLMQLKANKKATHVTLAPLMFVAGDHANNDIAVDWKEALEKEGYHVSVRMEGLGQIPEIQEMFIEHIRFSLKHRIIDIMNKKKTYAEGTAH